MSVAVMILVIHWRIIPAELWGKHDYKAQGWTTGVSFLRVHPNNISWIILAWSRPAYLWSLFSLPASSWLSAAAAAPCQTCHWPPRGSGGTWSRRIRRREKLIFFAPGDDVPGVKADNSHCLLVVETGHLGLGPYLRRLTILGPRWIRRREKQAL